MNQRYEELLRRLAVHDEVTVEAALRMYVSDTRDSSLDAKTTALVRLAGLVALQSSPQSYEWSVAAALDTGATVEEIVGVLVAVAPVVGVTRVNQAAGDVAAAVGYDVDAPGRE